MVTVALIASIVSIILAGFAIWQANHHRNQSDKLNRDTTEKLARIEAFATFTKEDAFAEIKRWGDFARTGGKASEEAEKAKEEEMRKLKEEIQASTSVQINKVLQTVESKLSSSTQASTISEIRKEFEELKREIGKTQDKALLEFKRLGYAKRFNSLWLSLSKSQRILLAKVADEPEISKTDVERIGITSKNELMKLVRAAMIDSDAVSYYRGYKEDDFYRIELSSDFKEFVKDKDMKGRSKKHEMD